MKRVLLIVIIALGIAGLLYYFFTREKEEETTFIRVSGNIEATEVDVGFKNLREDCQPFLRRGGSGRSREVLAKLDDERSPQPS